MRQWLWDWIAPDGFPPVWLRHMVPMWLLQRINRRPDVCWTALCMWKIEGSEWSWDADRCYQEVLAGAPTCYCGQLRKVLAHTEKGP